MRVSIQSHSCSHLELDGGVVFEESGADLWPFCVEQHSAVTTRPCSHRLAQVREAPSVELVVAVGEIEARDVHASVQQLA